MNLLFIFILKGVFIAFISILAGLLIARIPEKTMDKVIYSILPLVGRILFITSAVFLFFVYPISIIFFPDIPNYVSIARYELVGTISQVSTVIMLIFGIFLSYVFLWIDRKTFFKI